MKLADFIRFHSMSPMALRITVNKIDDAKMVMVQEIPKINEKLMILLTHSTIFTQIFYRQYKEC